MTEAEMRAIMEPLFSTLDRMRRRKMYTNRQRYRYPVTFIRPGKQGFRPMFRWQLRAARPASQL